MKSTLEVCAAPVIFFAAHFLYLWLRVDPRLLYEGSNRFPPFRLGIDFLRGTVGHPGGASEYLAAAAAQTYFWGGAGALVITAVSAILFFETRALVRLMGGPERSWLPFVPPLLILGAYGAYGQPLGTLCALAVSLAFVLGYARLAPGRGTARLALFVLLGAVAYFAAGGAFMEYAIVGVLAEARLRGDRLRTILGFVLAAAVPLAVWGLGCDLIPLAKAYAHLSALDPSLDAAGRPLLAALDLFFPLLAGWLARRRAADARATGAALPVRPALLRALGAVGALAIVLLPFNPLAWQSRRVHFYTARHQWTQVLAEARCLPPSGFNYAVAHNVTRALFESGQLLTDLFRYPVSPDALAICTPGGAGNLEILKTRLSSYLDVGEQALEFGVAGAAAHEAHEALAVWGEHATTLRRLALIYLARGEPDAARVFLNDLSRDPLQGKWARDTLARLERDPRLDHDPEMRRLRSVILVEDPPLFFSNLDGMCNVLLGRNPRNRMAFEYLVASRLVQRDPEGVVKELRRLGELGYPRIPPLCEEAVILREAQTGKPVDLGGYRVSEDTRRRFGDFQRCVVPLQSQGRMEEAKQAAEADFGATFFYYYVFGQPGGAR